MSLDSSFWASWRSMENIAKTFNLSQDMLEHK